MPTELEKSLYRTLAYFAYFSFPLTSLELYKWSGGEGTSLYAVERALGSSSWLAAHGVVQCEGFWAIGDCAAWRRERITRMTDALRKSRTLVRLVRIAALLPWIRLVAVCNSLAFSFTSAQSDIDVLVVTSPKRIWSTRLALTGALALLRARPGERARDPLCLSFFVADDALDLSSVKIGADDPYLMMWIATLAPVFDRGDVLKKLRAANGWMREDLPRAYRVERAWQYSVRHRWALPDFGFVEGIAERLQRNRLPAHLRAMMNRDSRVVVTNSMLKFHANDRRDSILAAWRERCALAGVSIAL